MSPKWKKAISEGQKKAWRRRRRLEALKKSRRKV